MDEKLKFAHLSPSAVIYLVSILKDFWYIEESLATLSGASDLAVHFLPTRYFRRLRLLY